MQAMVCELCGSNDIVKQDGLFVCQHCGTKYSVEDAKKLIGSVKIDRTDETENLLILARRARAECNAENAEKYYGLVLQNSPKNWEASFYHVYYQAVQCRVVDISNSALSIMNNLSSTFQLIQEEVPENEQSDAIGRIGISVIDVTKAFASSIIEFSKENATSSSEQIECNRRIVVTGGILEEFEKCLKQYFPNKKDLLLSIQTVYNKYICAYADMYNEDFCEREVNRLTNEIQSQDTSYTHPKIQKSGCYVATCVYGTYDCPQVWTLRRYRDFALAKKWYGQAFIRIYYAISPSIVKWFGNTNWFKKMWRGVLDEMVLSLNEKGYKNTPYNDKKW